MNKPVKMLIILVLIVAAMALIAVKESGRSQQASETSDTIEEPATSVKDSPVSKVEEPVVKEVTAQQQPKDLPKLLELGANKCFACKMMKPILAELKNEYAGKLKIEFLDVSQNYDLVSKYNISVIPVQIFYDSSGKELSRHTGFFPKDEILAKWKELGVDL